MIWDSKEIKNRVTTKAGLYQDELAQDADDFIKGFDFLR